MKSRLMGSTLAIVGLGVLLGAQTPPAAPKPAPEHKALTYFVGKWKGEGEMKPSPIGPGGKMTSLDTCEWFTGSFHVVCRGTGTSPMGKMTSLGVIAYNAGEKAYTFYGIDSSGMGELSLGQKSGSTWTFTATSNIGGQTIHSRYTITETSPTAYTFKWEASQDKKTWMVVAEGKSTKV